MTAVLDAPATDLRRALIEDCPLAPWNRGVVRAVGKLGQAHEKLAEVEADLAARRAAVAELEAGAGQAVLDELAEAARIGDRVTSAQAAIRALGQAARACHGRIVEAERGVLEAQAAELRERYRSARSVYRKHRLRTDEMLEALHEHEGVQYEPPRRVEAVTGELGRFPVSTRGDELEKTATMAAIRFWLVTEALEHGEVPQWTEHPLTGWAQVAVTQPTSVRGPLALRPPAAGFLHHEPWARFRALASSS